MIGALVLAAFLPEVTCWRLPLRRVSLAQRAAHGVASLSAWVGSVLYHLFMSHRAGERAYDLLLSFDVTCIWIASVVGEGPTNIDSVNLVTGCSKAFFLVTILTPVLA